MGSPASAEKPSTRYNIVLKIGNMATTTFVADGNKKGNKIHDHTATTTLDLPAVGQTSKDHSSFGVCGSPGNDPTGKDPIVVIDPDPLASSSPPIVWNLGRISVSRNEVGMRFGLNFADACGFDSYVVTVRLDNTTGGTGVGTYTDPEGFIAAQHYAETENTEHPPGPRRISHNEDCCFTPFFATTTPVTITITPN